jgi:hypothetical protein
LRVFIFSSQQNLNDVWYRKLTGTFETQASST